MSMRWYIVHAYSNFEKKVAEFDPGAGGAARPGRQVRGDPGADREGRRGAPRPQGQCRAQVLSRLCAGARCDLTDEVYHLIKNTPKVTGFLGADKKPMPISGCRGRAHQGPGGRGRRAAEALDHLRDRRAGAGRRRARSPRSTASSRRSTRAARASRWRCRSSAAPRRSSSNTRRSRRSEPTRSARRRVARGRHRRRHASAVESHLPALPAGQPGVAPRSLQPPRRPAPAGVFGADPWRRRSRVTSSFRCRRARPIPSPPIGPALGQRGLNIMEFCKAFNARTAQMEKGTPIPVVITAYQDRSFTFEMKLPPVVLLPEEGGGHHSRARRRRAAARSARSPRRRSARSPRRRCPI